MSDQAPRSNRARREQARYSSSVRPGSAMAQMPQTTPIRDSARMKLQNLTRPELRCRALFVVTDGSYCIICINPAGVEYLVTLSYSLGTSLLNIA